MKEMHIKTIIAKIAKLGQKSNLGFICTAGWAINGFLKILWKIV